MMNIYSKTLGVKVLAENPVQIRSLLEHTKVLRAWGDHGPSDFKTVWINLERLESKAACKILAVTCFYQWLWANYIQEDPRKKSTLPALFALHMHQSLSLLQPICFFMMKSIYLVTVKSLWYTGFLETWVCQRDSWRPCLRANAPRMAMDPVQELLKWVMAMLPWFSAQAWVPEGCWVKYSTNNTSLLLNYLKEPASKGWGYGSVVRHIFSMYEVLKLIPSPWTLGRGWGRLLCDLETKNRLQEGLLVCFVTLFQELISKIYLIQPIQEEMQHMETMECHSLIRRTFWCVMKHGWPKGWRC